MRALAVALLLLAPPAVGQDTLTLAALQEAAVQGDPRARQLALQDSVTRLRLRNIAAERLPALTLRGQASYQSEVPRLPLRQDGGEAPQPPKDRYELALDVDQLLYDGGALNRRRAAEEANLRAEVARIAAVLYPLRAEVNQAFFRALLLQERVDETELLIQDLDARLTLLRSRERQGAALPSDTAVVRAEMLRAMQTRSEVEADRRAALFVLGDLVGRRLSESDVLMLPDLAAAVIAVQPATAPADTGALRAHPQYEVFRAERERLERQSAVVQSQTRPQVSAFGQFGYGRPGLQQFTRDVHDYWIAGVRLRWRPWDWGATRREREALRLQQETVRTEEDAFTRQLGRQVHDALQTMQRLPAAIALDEQIITLRDQVERTARAQLAERAITPAEYVDARTDLQEARLAMRRHRIELAEARARYLTTLGVAPES